MKNAKALVVQENVEETTMRIVQEEVVQYIPTKPVAPVTVSEELKKKVYCIDNEEESALQWLNTDDIYETLNPSFIGEIRLRKMSLVDNGKAVMIEHAEENEVEEANEERFQPDLFHTKMISTLQTSLPEGEPSTRFEEDDGLYEEEMVDFELTPPCSPTVVLYEAEAETGEEGEKIVSSLVVGLEAVGGNVDAATCGSGELQV